MVEVPILAYPTVGSYDGEKKNMYGMNLQSLLLNGQFYVNISLCVVYFACFSKSEDMSNTNYVVCD